MFRDIDRDFASLITATWQCLFQARQDWCWRVFYTAWHKLVSQALYPYDSPCFLFLSTSLWSCAYRTYGGHLYFICYLLDPPIQKHLMTAHPVPPVSHKTTGCLTLALHEPELHQLRPQCGLIMGDKSHLKEGKRWKNGQKELRLLEDLKLWIFSEKHCT